jgi:hypothetical protein
MGSIKPAMIVYVDVLSLSSLAHILASWFRGWVVRRHGPLTVRYYNRSPQAKSCMALLGRLLPVRCEELDYLMADVKDPQGALCLYRVVLTDVLEVCGKFGQQELEHNPLFQRCARKFGKDRLRIYLTRYLAPQVAATLRRVTVVAWYHRTHQADSDASPSLYHARIGGFRYAQGYAADHGVELRSYWQPRMPRFKGVHRSFPILARTIKIVLRKLVRRSKTGYLGHPSAGVGIPGVPVIAASFEGNSLSLDPSRNSDLFWFSFTEAAPNQVMLYATRPDYPLDRDKQSMLNGAGIRALAIRPAARTDPQIPLWRPSGSFLRQYTHLALWLVGQSLLSVCRRPSELRWMVARMLEFARDYAYWYDFLKANGVKVHLSTLISGPASLALEQALADLGGISASYQRSLAVFASSGYATSADVYFAFGPQVAGLQREAGSSISQVVVTGYLHDHAFVGVRSRAKELRDRLQRNGAEFIVCWLDESPVGDRRDTILVHEDAAANYEYLLNRLLKDSTLGLVVKPKKPATLWKDLGPVADLLRQAVATGRCHIFEDGPVSTSTLPCEAALAADVTIGLLVAGTAALESSLAGARTVLLDENSVNYSPLYSLGRGSVAFTSWDELWDVMTAFRRDPSSLPGFGEWSPTVETLDPFRDGRAAERIGAYVTWLAAGLEKGLSVEETMEQASKRYQSIWGADKVTSVRPSATHSVTAESSTAVAQAIGPKAY